MILKEKLFLANCDSVRKLNEQEVRARFMAGVLFADGIVLSPNLLIDNPWLIQILDEKSIKSWFARDQHNESKLVIRGFNINQDLSFAQYFDDLNDNYVVSQFGGIHKRELTPMQLSQIHKNLATIDHVLKSYEPTIAPLEIHKGALATQISQRLLTPPNTLESDSEYQQWQSHRRILNLLESRESDLSSRSQWYNALQQLHIEPEQLNRFRLEVVDASYNGLFVGEGEAFVMDRILGLEQLPMWLLNSGVAISSRREELRTLKAGYKLFNLISTLGSEELIKVVADKALEYAEDKAKKRGVSWCERKNWFGLYPKLTQVMGVELKS